MSDWNLFSFQKYVRDSFPNLERSLNQQQDGRDASSVSIDASDLAYSFFFQTLLGKTSIHQLDQWLRSSMADELFDRNPHENSGSDSTLLDAADGWNVSNIRSAAQCMTRHLQRQGLLTLELSDDCSVRPATLDGSDFGGHRFSVLTLPGSSVQSLWDIEPYDTLGDERSASHSILQRLKQTDSSAPFSHLLLDGLYMDRTWFHRGFELGFRPVIKTTEHDLACVQRLQTLWESHQNDQPLPEEATVISGSDEERGYTFNALQHSNIPWQNLQLNGLHIQVTYTSGRYKGKTETYWVFTTDRSLCAGDLRRLAHHRWSIENNQFKELNQLVGSKSSYIQESTKKHTILFWQMIGWTLFQAFRLHCKQLLQSMNYGYCLTKSWLIERLKEQTYEQMINAPPDKNSES